MSGAELVIQPNGDVRMIYSELIDSASLGRTKIVRGSHVEPSDHGWWADLSPVDGPTLGPFDKRSDALAAEICWLRDHWLVPDSVRHSGT